MQATTGILRCRQETCLKFRKNVLQLCLSVQGVASVAFCECIPIEDALLARGFYLIGAAEPLIALSTDVLDFFCVLKDVSTGPLAGVEVILSRYLCIKGSDVDPALLTSTMNAAVMKYYQDHYRDNQPEPMQVLDDAHHRDLLNQTSRNVERRDRTNYNGRGRRSPIAAAELSPPMTLEKTHTAQTRGDKPGQVNKGCRIYNHDTPENINLSDITDIMVAQPSPLDFNRLEGGRFIGSTLCFARQDIEPLRSANACLPAGTVDGCGMLVQHLFDRAHPSPYALFPPYAWQAFVRNDGTANAVIWNHSRRARFWEKHVWMIPIYYRGNHWFLGVINLRHNTLWIFDSLYCKEHIVLRSQQLIQFVYKMWDISKMYQQTLSIPSPFEAWDAIPAASRPLQSNGFDCGLWVVACVAAVIRGSESVVGEEIELPRFRKWLYAHALHLPTTRT